MEVQYEINLEDVLALSEYHRLQSPTLRRGQRTSRLVVPICLAGTWFLVFCFGGEKIGPQGLLGFGLFLGVMGVVYFVRFPVRYRRRLRRLTEQLWRESQNRDLFARRQLTITPETITEATEITVTTMKWVAIEKIVIDRSHAYFFSGAQSAILLPKAAFATEDEFRQFVETAERYHRDAAG